MNKLRYILLFPFSFIYGFIVTIRNWMYSTGVLRSYEKNIPTLIVGNLTVGGTGKTPHIEFLITHLSNELHIAVLSRGYKRKTRGFLLVTPSMNAAKPGDEPLQIKRKYPEIPVAVCEDRSRGVDELLKAHPDIELILLDDAFQHRRLKPGLSILLTDYNRLYTRDSMLPGGNLREPVRGSKRAGYILVTKCPANLQPIDLRIIELEINPRPGQEVFFSELVYDKIKPLFPQINIEVSDISDYTILLVTGIVSPRAIQQQLQPRCSRLVTLQYPDHHDFSNGDLSTIKRKFESLKTEKKLIITTEKDAARLIDMNGLSESVKKHIFVLPVRVQLLNQQTPVFIQKIIDYVRENKRNC